MAATAARAAPSRPPSEIAIDRVWRFFCSVRAAVAEIATLAILVLIGTLRGSEVPQWIADAAPPMQGLVDRWYAFDVFGSTILAGLLAVISIAIAVCTINRVPGIWQTISQPRVRTTRGYLERAEASATYVVQAGRDSVAGSLTEALEGKRYRVLTEHHGDAIHVYADKNRFAKFGTFPFHLALILLLVGGIVSSYFGFREAEFVVAEGMTRDIGNGTGLSVRLNAFEDSYTPVGIAEEFRSNIDVYRGDDRVAGGDVTVNDPLSYRTVTFYQSGFGFTADLRVTDASGRELFEGPIELGTYTATGNDEAPAGFIELPGTGHVLTVVAPDTDPLSFPERDQLQLSSGQIWVQISPVNGTGSTEPADQAIVNQGQPLPVAGYVVTFERESRYATLQIAYNPGIPIFAIASVLLVGGLSATFYWPLRRIRGMISASPDGTMLRMVPLARRDWSGKREFFALAERTGERLGSAPHVKRPAQFEDWEPVSDSASPLR